MIERERQIAHARDLAAAEQAMPAPRRTISVTNTAGNFDRRGTAQAHHFDGVERRKPVNRAPLAGHEAFLAALRQSNADLVVEKMTTGDIYYGKLRHSDKFTLTMNVTAIRRTDGGVEQVDPCDRVIFKHDISEFYTTTPRPAGEGYRA
jgi:hypothetical protein